MRNQGKLLILCGISNSGKSTYAAQLVQSDPENYIRVNRDSIRSILYGYTDETVKDYYSREDLPELESQVTVYEDLLIGKALTQGKTVVVDNTHLKRYLLEEFEFWKVPTEIKFFDIELHEAVDRERGRTRKVGIEVMQKQIRQYFTLKESLEKEPINFFIYG